MVFSLITKRSRRSVSLNVSFKENVHNLLLIAPECHGTAEGGENHLPKNTLSHGHMYTATPMELLLTEFS